MVWRHHRYQLVPESIHMRRRFVVRCIDLGFIALALPMAARAQTPTPAPAPSAWYEKIRIRGYGQIRYNRLLETNDSPQCEQCDRSWGANGRGLLLPRGASAPATQRRAGPLHSWPSPSTVQV